MAKLSALKTMLAEARYNGVDAIPIPHVQRDSEGHVLTMFNSRHITSFVEIQVWDFLYWSFFGAPPYMATSNSAGRKKNKRIMCLLKLSHGWWVLNFIQRSPLCWVLMSPPATLKPMQAPKRSALRSLIKDNLNLGHCRDCQWKRRCNNLLCFCLLRKLSGWRPVARDGSDYPACPSCPLAQGPNITSRPGPSLSTLWPARDLKKLLALLRICPESTLYKLGKPHRPACSSPWKQKIRTCPKQKKYPATLLFAGRWHFTKSGQQKGQRLSTASQRLWIEPLSLDQQLAPTIGNIINKGNNSIG